MIPSFILLVLLEITIAAVMWQILVRRRRTSTLQRLAKEWDMHFQSTDHFNLTAKMVDHLPIPGAAAIKAIDLLYTQQAGDFFCAFTVSFTRGAVGTKHRQFRVAAIRQIGDRHTYILAPDEGNVSEQYAFVRNRLMNG